MSQSARTGWCEALKLVPARWRAQFCRFVEEGQAGDEFLAFLSQNEDCRRACEIVLRADQAMTRILAAAAEPLSVPVEANSGPASR